MPYFEDNHIDIRLLTTPNNGFRPGQIGALHATLSHTSVYDEPAILSLPTGYGKTAVIMALPFMLRATRVLVVEPSNALRQQTAGHFKVLSVLRKIGIATENLTNPAVLAQKGRPTSSDEWEKMREYDVVISTPHSTSPRLTPNPPADLFDLIIFDEAHHAPAETWNSYLERFDMARFIFLTATPFRRDRKPIPGRIAYNYPVTKAHREKAFGKVLYTAAPVRNDQDENEVDRSVAQVAADQLRKDKQAGYEHRIFARAASIKAAKALVTTYEKVGVKVAAVTSHISKINQDKIEAKLVNGELDGVVCVDMFGEGYDFPKLKIAALHAPHRSLVPTLQFIGRFARTNDENTGDATLVAPKSRIRDATFKLLQEGLNIAELIDDVAEEEIAGAEADREILELLKLKKQAISDYDAVSPLLLKLYAHARIFHCGMTPDFSLVENNLGRNLQLVKQWMSEDGLIALYLTVDHSPPNWATSDTLANLRHDAFLIAFNDATKLCFIGSTRRTDRIYLDLMDTVCSDQHRPVSYEIVRRALAGLNRLRFYSVGLRNTAINSQAESYRMLTGPNAHRAVTAGDGRAYVQGHFFGSGVSGEERETIGASSSSRVWSNKRLTVAEYLEWISLLNARLNGNEEVAPSQLDIIQHARMLKEIPKTVIGASWDKVAYRSSPRVRYKHQQAEDWEYCQITDMEMKIFETSNDQKELHFLIGTDLFEVPFIFSLGGGVLIKQVTEDWAVEVMSGADDWIPIAPWLAIHPPSFYASDKSSFQGVNQVRPPRTTAESLAAEDTLTFDWVDCATQIEYEATKTDGLLTVHQYLERQLQNRDGIQVLIYDHRSGEAADYIAITEEGDGAYRVSLYHCKGAGGEPSGTRIGDVIEVAGQMLKSVAYCEASVLIEHIKHRTIEYRHKHPSKIVVGDLTLLEHILANTPANKLFFDVFAVQPGISKSQIDEHLADLMLFGLEYVRRGGAAKAAWIISP